jgi:hypothetical protein
MPITISNTSLVIDGSKATWTVPSPLLFMGEIVRLFNSSSTTQTYNYTGIDGITTSSAVQAATSSYILARSGSISDNSTTSEIAIIRLFITASEVGNPFSEQLITTTGAGTWTKPEGVTQVVVECWGGGGAGGGCTATDSAGGGGAGAQYARKYIVYSSNSQNIGYSVGSGGVGSTGNGQAGEDTTWATNVAVAKGGGGGKQGISIVPGGGTTISGLGATGSLDGGIGDLVRVNTRSPSNGGDGTVGLNREGNVYSQGGEGGNGAGSTPDRFQFGGIISEQEFGGSGGQTDGVLINGGANGNDVFTAILYGSAGSGASKISGANRSGGDGAQGLIRILYR